MLSSVPAKKQYKLFHNNILRSLIVLVWFGTVGGLNAQDLSSPEVFFGHQIGADYELPDYTDLTAYWETLAAESPRIINLAAESGKWFS